MLSRRFILIGFTLLLSSMAIGQSISTTFGKNRVQYHDDFKYWDKYETENFVTYWYGKAQNVGQTVVQMAEMDHDAIQDIMEHRFNNKIEIIVYTDVSDLKQSNLGSGETFTNKIGQTKIVGNKMFVYFNGNHAQLRKQIKEGIATVYLNSILFGSSLQEIVQNAVLLDIPEWFKQGLVSYIGSGWDYLLDDELRDLLMRTDKNYLDFLDLAEDHPKIAGHSLWHYIDQNYGKSSISNILYLSRINRDMESSFLYVLSTPFDQVVSEWSAFYEEQYLEENAKFEHNYESLKFKTKNKNYQPISQIKISPSGRYVAYAYNDIGKVKVTLLDLANEEQKNIFKHGQRNAFQETDFNYPLISWHPYLPIITLVYEKKDRIYLHEMNVEVEDERVQLIPESIQRIYSISHYEEDQYILSATDNGFSDLFIYNTKNRNTKKITDDYHDDLSASYVSHDGRNGILFKSTRPSNSYEKEKLDTLLPLEKFDLFFLDLDDKEKRLDRLTFTPKIDEDQPIYIGDDKIAFLAKSSGIKNRFIKNLTEDGNGYVNSNKGRNIILHTAQPESNIHIYTDYREGAYLAYIESYDRNKSVKPTVTSYHKYVNGDQPDGNLPLPIIKNNEPDPEAIIIMKEGYKFQSKFEDPPELEKIRNVKQTKKSTFSSGSALSEKEYDAKNVLHFNKSKIVASRLRFKLDNFTSKLDNDILFEGLESYTGEDQDLTFNPMGILLKANIKDILEDYSIEGGVRIPTSFNGSEYFLYFDNNKKLIDTRIALYRKSRSQRIEDPSLPLQTTKRTTLLGLYQAKYPFDIFRSLRLTGTIRNDRFFLETVDRPTLNSPFDNEKRISLKAEYIYDNSLDVDLNVKNGTRYKFYAEVINRFDIQVVDGFNFEASKGFTTVVGFDFRHYVPVLKHGVLALRAAGASSFGSDKILYYLGGVENWILSEFDNTIPQPTQDAFAFRVLAPNLRGFDVNIRNGSSYALINSELRLPIFQLLIPRRVKSNFLRNFQLVFFYDVGTAWQGLSPYSRENPLNTLTIETPVISLDVEYFRDPLVMGFGPGVRASLFGYFVRLDYAYGVETRRISEPKLYFSIGLDF